MHFLFMNQDIQDQVNDEIETVIEEREISYEALAKITYLVVVAMGTIANFPSVQLEP